MVPIGRSLVPPVRTYAVFRFAFGVWHFLFTIWYDFLSRLPSVFPVVLCPTRNQ